MNEAVDRPGQHDRTIRRGRRTGPGRPSFVDVTETVCGIAESRKTPTAWYVAFVVSAVA